MDSQFINEIMKPVYSEFQKISDYLTNSTEFTSKEYHQKQKEYNRLQKVLHLEERYFKIYKEFNNSQEMLKDETDEEMIDLLEQEVKTLEPEINALEENISLSLLPLDPSDDSNAFIEIRSGAGGDESSIFIGDLYRMYSLYAQSNNFKIEIMNSHEGTSGGFKELTFLIKGESPYATFKYESGVHRVQRVPKTETQGRVHTSTITVAVIPETEDSEFQINPEDIKIETTRAQGAGGQHVNKTESAVRIYHLPTGIITQCQDERSQFKNKEKAMRVLKAKLKDKFLEEQKAAEDSLRRSQIGTGDRAEKIRTYNFPQNRLTDHRIGLTLYSLDRIINGDLVELFSQLTIADKKYALSEYLKKQQI